MKMDLAKASLLGWAAATLVGLYGGYALFAAEQTSGADVTTAPPSPESEVLHPPAPYSSAKSTRPSIPPQPAAKSAFSIDQNGELLLDRNTVGAMRDVLSRYSPKLTPAEQEKIESAALAGLREPALSQARTLLRAYLKYQPVQDAFEASEEYGRLPRQEVLEKTMALRRKYFDRETSLALFGEEEAAARYDLGVIGIAADKTLDNAEKAKRIKALRQELPAAAVIGPESAEVLVEFEQQAAELRLRGAPDQEMLALRKNYFGEPKSDIAELQSPREDELKQITANPFGSK